MIGITETEGYKHLLKYATKHTKLNEYYYPFVQHPRFKFWVYDRLRRRRALEQSKIYLKQNLGDASLTIKNKIGFENAINIYNDNDSVDKKNYNELIKKNKPITELRAINSNKKGASASSQQFGGLVNSIFLSNKCDISITNNLWGKTGIVNGCKAVIKDIVYPGEKNIDTLPDTIIVLSTQYIGPQFFHDELRRNWIPIAPHSQYSKVANCTCKQFSLVLLIV